VQITLLTNAANSSDVQTVTQYMAVNGPIAQQPCQLIGSAGSGSQTRRRLQATGSQQTVVTVNIQVPPQYPDGTTGVEDWLDRQLTALQNLFVLDVGGTQLTTAVGRTLGWLKGVSSATASITLQDVSFLPQSLTTCWH
jgi:hypothetical protein